MILKNNKVEYISASEILSDFYDDFNIDGGDDEPLLLKWIEDKISQFNIPQQLIHRVAWVSVMNYKADLPKDLNIINEVAFRLDGGKSRKGGRGYQLTQFVQNTHEDCQIELNVVCSSCNTSTCNCNTEDIIVDVNAAFEMAHPEMYYSKYAKVGKFGYGKSIYSNNWGILSQNDSEWFGVNQTIPGCANIHCHDCPNSYKILPPKIETSFEEGELLISYMGVKKDEDGRLMIPLHPDVLECVNEHLTYKWFRRQFIKTRDNGDRLIYSEARQLSKEAKQKAEMSLNFPSFDEFSRFWANTKWSKMSSAYENLMGGGVPVNTQKKGGKNPYRS